MGAPVVHRHDIEMKSFPLAVELLLSHRYSSRPDPSEPAILYLICRVSAVELVQLFITAYMGNLPLTSGHYAHSNAFGPLCEVRNRAAVRAQYTPRVISYTPAGYQRFVRIPPGLFRIPLRRTPVRSLCSLRTPTVCSIPQCAGASRLSGRRRARAERAYICPMPRPRRTWQDRDISLEVKKRAARDLGALAQLDASALLHIWNDRGLLIPPKAWLSLRKTLACTAENCLQVIWAKHHRRVRPEHSYSYSY